MLTLTVKRMKKEDDGILIETSDGPIAVRFIRGNERQGRIGISAPISCNIKRAAVDDAIDRIRDAEGKSLHQGSEAA